MKFTETYRIEHSNNRAYRTHVLEPALSLTFNDKYTEIKLEEKAVTIELKEVSVSAEIDKRMPELEKMGIDPIAQVKHVIDYESETSVQRDVFNKMLEKGKIGESRNHTKFQKFFAKIGYVPKQHVYDSVSAIKTLFSASSSLHKSVRLQRPDFAIVSFKMLMYLTDSPDFVYYDKNSTIMRTDSAIIHQGRIGNIDVFINSYMKEEDPMVVGISNRTHVYGGVIAVHDEPQIFRQDILGVGHVPRERISKVMHLGIEHLSHTPWYLSVHWSEKRHNLITYIRDVIKNKFKHEKGKKNLCKA